MGKGNRNVGRISVFKGREARLNFAVFQVLALKGPQTIYDIHKKIRTQRGLKYTKYASVNKRVRHLEESEYIKRASARRTRAGFEAATYELTPKTYVAILLDSADLESLISCMDEAATLAVLAALICSL